MHTHSERKGDTDNERQCRQRATIYFPSLPFVIQTATIYYTNFGVCGEKVCNSHYYEAHFDLVSDGRSFSLFYTE